MAKIIPGQPHLSPYFDKKEELSLFEGCLLWGSRVVIPEICRDAVRAQLHEGHQGMVRTKSLARMYIWWPGINRDIDRLVRQCSSCQQTQKQLPEAPLHSWSWPTRPWARLHLDYAGPVEGKMVLVIVDAHSKWIEAIHTSTATSGAVIEACRERFAQFGLPETIVTDNGTCFVSSEFEMFLTKNGIKHITTAPYHPASNGLAERSVQIVKTGLKREQHGTFRSRLSHVLASYRLTPQTTTGKSPCELLLGRRTRSRLDFLRPNTADKVEQQLARQKQNHDTRKEVREFSKGSLVFVRNPHAGDRWIRGVVVSAEGSVSYSVKLDNGRVRKCHIDQLRERPSELSGSPVQVPPVDVQPTVPVIPTTVEPSLAETPPVIEQPSVTPPTAVEDRRETSERVDVDPPATTPKVYPKRNRTNVERYDPSFK